ncbi:CRISPR-associated endonuclease Cas2 [Tissierella creatinini]|nr:CRISPR-associated endonuclease Cas2 [Tissierella creatinini]TJX64603.1 CRISPR-associated endonuclease Cas2 [Soehngenia saccharolytica]
MTKPKAKNYNYNYVFLFYDVNVKRVSKVFKVCKKYLERYQLSVFRGNITPSNLIKLRNELKNIINDNEDTVAIIKLPGDFSFDEEIMGIKLKDETNLFF